MALSKIDVANFLDGTIPQGNVANASLGAVTALPAAISTGKILQVVRATSTTTVSNTSSSTYVDGNPNLNITPLSSSSKIYLQFNIHTQLATVSGSIDNSLQYKIYRDSTELREAGSVQHYRSAAYSGNTRDTKVFDYIDDAHGTTNQITYKYQFRNPHNSQSIATCASSMLSTIHAWEIAT